MFASLARAMFLFSVLAAAGIAYSQQPLPPLPPPEDTPNKIESKQAGVKVAEKGPIHEAFAQPGAEVRGKDMNAPKVPPPTITEVPPDSKPEGANVKWIPGYWQWDENKNDFIWVSGFYRNVPPNRAWEPGKWIEKDGKNVYVPGFWRPIDGTSWREDVPEPPKSVESGPSIPNDNPNAMWVPGGWEYRDKKFVWRAGYWAAPYRDMMWQPSQYVFNGDNYYYMPGYWDYPLENRGLLNAPVYVDQQFIQNPNWSFTPQYGIGVGDANGWGNGGLFESMYIGPNYNNYYYGNQGDPFGFGGLGFGQGYGEPLFGYGGFFPWWGMPGGFYNPLWNHYNWLNRNNNGWGGNARGGRNGQRGGAPGVVGARTVGPRTVGASPNGAGIAGQNGGRGFSNQSGQFIRPSNQVLANQSARANAPGIGGTLGGFTNAGSIIPSSGVNFSPGVNSAGGIGGSSYRGLVTQPSIRSYGGGVHAVPSYHGGGGGGVRASGGRSSGGGGRGGHR